MVQGGGGLVFLLVHPQMIFEASTTQNDLVTLLVFALVAYFFLQYMLSKQESDWMVYRFLFLVVFGGLLKYSLWVFELPICIAFGLVFFKRNAFAKIQHWILYLLLIFLLIMGPFWMRNYWYYGNMLGDPMLSTQLGNSSPSLETIFSNGLKNLADYSFTPLNAINYRIFEAVVNVHDFFNLPVNDASRNFDNNQFQSQYYFSEDNASSLPHLLIFLLSVGLFFLRFRSNKQLWIVLIFIVVDFSLYNLIFKWQFFGIRLQLPMFYLAAGFVVILSQALFANNKAKYLVFLTCFFSIYGLFPLFFNKNKPVFQTSLIRSIVQKPKGLFLASEWKTLDANFQKSMKVYYTMTKDGHWALRKELPQSSYQECFLIQKNDYFSKAERTIWSNSRWQNYFILMPEVQEKIESGFLQLPERDQALRILADGYVDGWEYPYFVFLKSNFPEGTYLTNHLSASNLFKSNHPERSFFNSFPKFLIKKDTK